MKNEPNLVITGRVFLKNGRLYCFVSNSEHKTTVYTIFSQWLLNICYMRQTIYTTTSRLVNKFWRKVSSDWVGRRTRKTPKPLTPLTVRLRIPFSTHIWEYKLQGKIQNRTIFCDSTQSIYSLACANSQHFILSHEQTPTNKNPMPALPRDSE